ncbi:MAG TPA: acyl-CoA carboxylase subunit epsilon [Rugosimonospora sp.]|nr:acyl-CoA carboxylase subunit epsilon [Rugosimonospora sp.]
MDDEVFFRVVRGVPTAEELAALVGVLFQRSRVVPAAEAPARSRWRESGLPAITPRPGPGAWRASALPR